MVPHASPVGRLAGLYRRARRAGLTSTLTLLCFLFAIRSAVADWNDVPTGSMRPTIVEGDRIFVNKLAYDVRVPFTSWRLLDRRQPQRGDVVVFFSPKDGTRMVKRVIGLPGDVVEMHHNRVRIDGEPALYARPSDEPGGLDLGEHPVSETLGGQEHMIVIQPDRPSLRSFAPIEVPAGQYFVMGDNRDVSFDSRWFGFVSRDQIVGRATGIAMSLDPQRHYRPRWSRFLSELD